MQDSCELNIEMPNIKRRAGFSAPCELATFVKMQDMNGPAWSQTPTILPSPQALNNFLLK
jgi:hypothetical protein